MKAHNYETFAKLNSLSSFTDFSPFPTILCHLNLDFYLLLMYYSHVLFFITYITLSKISFAWHELYKHVKISLTEYPLFLKQKSRNFCLPTAPTPALVFHSIFYKFFFSVVKNPNQANALSHFLIFQIMGPATVLTLKFVTLLNDTERRQKVIL